MKNEIGRKLTSLTLMTIMFAGGMTFAIPGMMPAAHASHAPNLFVSAENSQFDNYFAGPMVLEVIVIDPNIDDTDEGKGEPDVDVNGKDLRMVQATDGNWYGYIADRLQAQTADETVRATGGSFEGLDFGSFCGTGTDITDDSGSATIILTNTVGIAVPRVVASGGSNGTVTAINANFPNCVLSAGAPSAAHKLMNVVRENKGFNPEKTGVEAGQININGSAWPFIQLFNFNPTGNVVIQYNRAGGVQSTTLTFDTVEEFASLEADRTVYPRGAHVHLTMTDLQLNIDPTDEDSWTFGSNKTNIGGPGALNNFGLFYQVFNEDGAAINDTSTNPNLRTARPSLMFEDNGEFILNPNADSAVNDIVNLFDNDDQVLVNTGAAKDATTATIFAAGNGLPVTFVELSSNGGVLVNYDESDNSNIRVTSNADRGRSAVVEYNDIETSIVQGFKSGKITMDVEDGEWNSGEQIPVVLIDNDNNLNSKTDEDLDIFNPDVFNVPALIIDDPFTIDEDNAFDDNSDANKQDVVFTSINPSFTTGTASLAGVFNGAVNTSATIDTLEFAGRALLGPNRTSFDTGSLVIDLKTTMEKLKETIHDPRSSASTRFHGFNLLNIDLRGINQSAIDGKNVNVYLLNASAGTEIVVGDAASNNAAVNNAVGGVTTVSLVNNTSSQSLSNLNDTSTTGSPDPNAANKLLATARLFDIADTDQIGLLFNYTVIPSNTNAKKPVVADFFSFGFLNEGLLESERISNQIIRFELEETGTNTATFAGTAEFQMINQITILDPKTYDFDTIDNNPDFIVIQDETDEDAPRVSYRDRGTEGTLLRQGDQADAPSHSGVVSFNAATYKIASPVTMTIDDTDLNTDVDVVDIYTPVNPVGTFGTDPAADLIGRGGLPSFSFGPLGQILEVTFDDERWGNVTGKVASCTPKGGLFSTGTTFIETGAGTGVFTGNFKVPGSWCRAGATTAVTTTGLDMEVNYLDFRDASGEVIEVGDSAGIRANTGSISLDRTVYPVPFGKPSNFETTSVTTPTGRSVFPIHQTGMKNIANGGTADGLETGEFIPDGELSVKVRVNDPDFNVSPAGENQLRENTTAGVGLVKITVSRGSNEVVLGYAGGPTKLQGPIDVGNNNAKAARQFGPMIETSPTSAVFESDIIIRYTDGPASALCPVTTDFTPITGAADTATNGVLDRFDAAPAAGTNYCILQGDILQVEYTDPTDASGDPNTVTDSATFDLRNGVLQSDKSVYIIGSDQILTLIEPDFDLDSDSAETYDLDLIEWDSDAATITMGNQGGVTNAANFDPEPTAFRETGKSTGIFQIVIEIPSELSQAGSVDKLERGEEIILEYTDWGPSGSDFVGDEDEDVNLTIFTSNFGATVELDQKVYTWTDKVYVTIVAPDHNFDSDLIDEIGNTSLDPIKVSTRGFNLDQYKLVETGTDTGIFTGEVILTGFAHDADGNSNTGADGTGGTLLGGDTSPRTQPSSGGGPTDGFLQTDDDDGITVSFEFSEDETVVGSALIRWNIGEAQWLEASYPASGTGVVRVVDPDMNLDPEVVDNFDVDIWSDSDAGGIDLTVTETNEATGIFEGTVFFTTTDESSGHRLRVSEGDTITAEYEDNTLPDPYTTADELDITGTSLIGTIVPPLERAPASNARVVDAFGNALASVSIDQQVQIAADLANGQDREQSFAYLVQIQDANGVTVSLAWITGSLSPGQSFSPALSWTPDAAGTYTATVFVWESVDNPTALSPPTTVDIPVS